MTPHGKTREQLSSAKELVACGVLVRLAAGLNVRAEYAAVGRSIPGHLCGIQHAKCVLAGNRAVVGSWNWTISSRSNGELGLLVGFQGSHLAAIEEMFLTSWHSGQDLSLASILEAQSGKVRSVAGELNRLLRQNSEDGAEICAAYVNGAVMAGDLEVAMTILPVWKEEYPADPQPYYAYARILEYQHDVKGAIRELELANEKASRFWPARYALGRILYGENRIEEALAQLHIATQMRANAAPLLQQARCLRSLSRLDEAHQILLALTQKDKSEIQQSFALVCEPEQGLPIEYELGTLEAAMGKHESAIRWLDKVLLADPSHLDARYARGISLQQTGRTTEAEKELTEVSRIRTILLEIDRLVDEINQSPNDPHLDARCRIGELYIRYENARHGVFWLHEALNRDPNYRPAHAILADYYTRLAETQAEYATLAEHHRQAAGRNGPADSKTGAIP